MSPNHTLLVNWHASGVEKSGISIEPIAKSWHQIAPLLRPKITELGFASSWYCWSKVVALKCRFSIERSLNIPT